MQATVSGKGVGEAPQRGNFHPSFKARGSKSALQLAAAAAPFIDARPGAPQGEAPLIIEEDKPEREVKYNPSLDSQLGGVFKQESFPEPPEAGKEDDRGYPSEDLIGGVPDPDRWKTVAMMLNNGESLTAKKVVKRPIASSGGVLNPTLISPITGEKLGSYGSWEQDEVAAAKREEEEAAAKLRAQEEEDNDTTDPLIKKLKKVLASRGAGGILGLQKRFKNMDSDGSGTLSMKEFRRGMKEMRMNLSEADMLSLFASLDPAGSGEITLTAFMLAITGYMNVRRRKLVNLAFDVLDKDGDGLATVDDIGAAYDVSKHPEFISGKRTKAEVLREFLDGFDVGGGEKDGIVTRQEFANYYTAISAIIHSDDYFELMIRNAWHISGGTGWSANSANLRVLVTHSDGEQEVVEIKNDLGLDPKDKKAVVARLRAQGVDVVAIPGYSDAKGAALALAKAAATIDNTLSGGKVKPPPRLGAGPVASLRSQVQEAQQAVSELTLPLLDKLRAQVKTRGASGFIGLQRAFRLMDEDGSNFLDMAEFKRAMKQINILLSEKQSQELFSFFDTDKSGTISLDEFLRGMQGEMSQRRQALVDMAFATLDTDGSGVIEPSDLVTRYDTSKHPDVVSKRKTPEAALKEFLDTFDVGGEVDGKVTRNEFRNYYANVSASIDDEDYFELMIRNAWHISGGSGAAANSANRRVLVTRADGSQAVEEIKNDLGLKADDKAGMMARLRAQGVDAAQMELYGGVDDVKAGSKTLPPRPAGRTAEPPGSRRPSQQSAADASQAQTAFSRSQPLAVQAEAPGSRRPSNSSAIVQPPNFARIQPPPAASARTLSSGSKPPAAPAAKVVQPTPALLIIAKLKDSLKSHGVNGHLSLQRKFRIMDDDDTRNLTMAEFKKGMRELQLNLTDAELRLLFEHFDADSSGSIDFEELLQGVSDPLSQRRLDLVYQAFAILDTERSGVIDASKLAAAYDASKHPEVIAGRMTQHEVLRSFLDTFDVGGKKDGQVTREEFVNYYTAVSASIDNEDYFELMIRNAWHISGGSGAAANSANRRVLVTRADGSQAVEEIKNDLGLKADDKAGMMARLRAQGVDAAQMELYGGLDATDKNARAGPPIAFAKVAFDEARAAELKRRALQLFNANDFSGAREIFVEMLGLHYVANGPGPEVDKLEKSVAMCEKRIASISAQQRLSNK